MKVTRMPDVPLYEVSSPGLVYFVTVYPAHMECSCPEYEVSRRCDYCNAVSRHIEEQEVPK
jgi:hypothetical protein